MDRQQRRADQRAAYVGHDALVVGGGRGGVLRDTARGELVEQPASPPTPARSPAGG
ncbi:MAG: hypothetical protein ACJ73S_22505 [Mycobacteriales bacterium]